MPVRTDDLDEDDDPLRDWEDDPAPGTDEETLRQRDRLRVVYGVSDLFGVIAGAVLILLLVAVLVSLVNWVLSDMDQFLAIWRQ